jgi:hypothetical protein
MNSTFPIWRLVDEQIAHWKGESTTPLEVWLAFERLIGSQPAPGRVTWKIVARRLYDLIASEADIHFDPPNPRERSATPGGGR